MGSRRRLACGVAATAIGAAAASALAVSAPAVPAAPPLDDTHVVVVDGAGESVVATSSDQEGALIPDEKHARWAIGAILGGIAGAFVSLLGASGALKTVGYGGRAAIRAAASATVAPARAARKTVKRLAEAAETPTRFAAKASVFTLGLLLAIALADVSWKASVAVGALSAGASIFGWRRRKSAAPAPKLA